jgi:hypothetical protein
MRIESKLSVAVPRQFSLTGVTMSELIRFGWKEKDIERLVSRINPILINFKKVVRNQVAVRVAFDAVSVQNPQIAALSDLESKVIYIFLSPGPKRVLDEAPAAVARGLVQLAKGHIEYSTKDLTKETDAAIDRVLGLFNPEIETGTISHHPAKDQYRKLFADFMQKMADHKLFMLLTESIPVSRKEFKAVITIEISDMKEMVKNVTVDTSQVAPNRTLVKFAMLAVLADRLGMYNLSTRCKSLFTGRQGQELALIDFGISSAGGMFWQPAYQTLGMIQRSFSSLLPSFDVMKDLFGKYFDAIKFKGLRN